MLFLEEIEHLAEILGISRTELLMMAREIAQDVDLPGLYALRPSHQHRLLVLLEAIAARNRFRLFDTPVCCDTIAGV